MTICCAPCGAPAPHYYRVPRPLQPPELDGRPGEPARATLKHWVATCPQCGASAPNLAALPAEAAAILRTEGYTALRAPGPAMPHLRWAYICTALGNAAAAAEATLCAAWALEDAGTSGDELRRKAASLFQPPANVAETLRVIDILRRAHAFAEAAALAGTIAPTDEAGQAILAFQKARIAARDAGRHQISAAIRPPAHRPHVSHGKTAGGGLFGRIFGKKTG